jgi:hypothetical protein
MDIGASSPGGESAEENYQRLLSPYTPSCFGAYFVNHRDNFSSHPLFYYNLNILVY